MRGAPASSAPQYADTDHQYQANARQMGPADAWWPEGRGNERQAEYRQNDRPVERSMAGAASAGYSVSGADRYSEFAGAESDEEFPRIVRGRLR